jgi:hypothetical protein
MIDFTPAPLRSVTWTSDTQERLKKRENLLKGERGGRGGKKAWSSINPSILSGTNPHLVGDAEEVPLLVGKLHPGLSHGLHGGGHVVVPKQRDTVAMVTKLR